MPSGIDIRLQTCTAFNKNQLDLKHFVEESRIGLLSTFIQHYEQQIPRLRSDLNVEYDALREVVDEKRFGVLSRDLAEFRRRCAYKCRKTS